MPIALRTAKTQRSQLFRWVHWLRSFSQRAATEGKRRGHWLCRRLHPQPPLKPQHSWTPRTISRQDVQIYLFFSKLTAKFQHMRAEFSFQPLISHDVVVREVKRLVFPGHSVTTCHLLYRLRFLWHSSSGLSSVKTTGFVTVIQVMLVLQRSPLQTASSRLTSLTTRIERDSYTYACARAQWSWPCIWLVPDDCRLPIRPHASSSSSMKRLSSWSVLSSIHSFHFTQSWFSLQFAECAIIDNSLSCTTWLLDDQRRQKRQFHFIWSIQIGTFGTRTWTLESYMCRDAIDQQGSCTKASWFRQQSHLFGMSSNVVIFWCDESSNVAGEDFLNELISL